MFLTYHMKIILIVFYILYLVVISQKEKKTYRFGFEVDVLKCAFFTGLYFCVIKPLEIPTLEKI